MVRALVYLDNAAGTQKPQTVVEAVATAYSSKYANVNCGLHFLSNLATENYETVRGKAARFLGMQPANEIVFLSNGTKAMNTVASGWLRIAEPALAAAYLAFCEWRWDTAIWRYSMAGFFKVKQQIPKILHPQETW